ncbi:MAG: hypothetical protein AYP45_01305 [Candidatus Brocadia carolinensis]|uniref:YrdC-like domain-containing protein n=1 Tax=Candidatus Brocadia carolinensis TaxID=1004156 RepID=A0A1V4AXE0_9BACT|nr:MAG: hypothetical protein AYP45_01305 [Candidatus Brocadia caroliniensis]
MDVNGRVPQISVSDLHLKTQNQQTVLKKTIKLLKKGAMLAIEGLGGFHLTGDAANSGTVTTLRESKRRPKKPFELMAQDREGIKTFCTHPDKKEVAFAVTSSSHRNPGKEIS